jgi:hypothetical protein
MIIKYLSIQLNIEKIVNLFQLDDKSITRQTVVKIYRLLNSKKSFKFRNESYK